MKISLQTTALAFVFVASAVPADDFAHWQTADAASDMRVDHAAWDGILAEYVRDAADGVNRFAYKDFPPAARTRLDAYIDSLQATTVTALNKPSQLAYWTNLYNAVTVQVILDHYPVESIRDIKLTLLNPWGGPWKKELVEVEGRALSLDNIEHDIVRPIFADARIHYAFNCASIGCPNLQPRAFTADNLEAMLDASAAEYINHPRGARFENDRLIASSLFDWYAEDFGADNREILQHLMQYAEGELHARLAAAEKIDEFYYDWALNE